MLPFFVEGGYAFCEGRGELITPISNSLDLKFVVVKPAWGLSTPDIFSRLRLPASPRTIDRQQLERSDFDWARHAFNRLQEPASECAEEIETICSELQELGCNAALMTGSGSCCFGICEDLHQAEKIAQQMANHTSRFVFTCRNLPKFPVRE